MKSNYHYKHGVRKKSNKLKLTVIYSCISVFVASVLVDVMRTDYSPAQYSSGLPIRNVANSIQPKTTSAIPWPTYGHAAFAVPDDDIVVVSKDDRKPVPIASLAKVITVLAVLDKHPLSPGEQGPAITMSEHDAALADDYARKGGTVTPVTPGEKISQYKALQSILMVSSNNMADTTAVWAFGSMETYVEYANAMLKELGLTKTTVADDASGYSPKTVSTAEDMAKIAYLYMKNPVLRGIAMQPQAKIPTAGLINNHNDFANDQGMIGIKLGNTDEARRCLLAAKVIKTEDGAEKISVGVVLGAQDFETAAKDAQKILNAGNSSKEL